MPNTVTIRTKIKDEASKGFGSLAGTLMQTVGGALIPAAAAAASLGIELIGAGAAAAVFGAAVAPQISSIKNVSTEQDTYNKAVAEYGKNSTQATAAQKKFKGDMDALNPATRQTASAFMNLKDTYSKWSDSLSGSTMPVFTHAMEGLKNIFPLLTPLVKSAAGQFDQLAVKFAAFTKTDRFKQLVGEFSSFASGALRNVISGITALSKMLVHGLESKGFRDFLAMGKKEGPGIVGMFKDLAQFIGKFVEAAGPMAGLQMKVLEVLASALNAIPMDVLKALAGPLMAAALAMKAFKLAMISYEALRGITLGFMMLSGATLDLDAAMDANPIGAVALALTALAVGVVYAYTHFKTFRLVVQDSFDALEYAGAGAVHGLLVALKGLADGWMDSVGTIIHGAALAFGWVPGVGGKLKAADSAFNSFKNSVDAKFNSMISKSKQWDSSATNSMRARKLKMDISDWTSKINSAQSQLKRNIPESKKIALRAEINDLLNKIRAARSQLSSVQGKTVHVNVVYKTYGLAAAQAASRARRAGGAAESGGLRGNQVLVGEGGPEVVDLPSGSYVHSNPDSQRLMGGSGGSSGLIVIPVYLFEGGTKFMDLVVDPLRKSVQKRGGVQAALGKL